MSGLFGIFGRAPELERLDLALRNLGVHPRAVPDAVKLTTVKLLKEARGGSVPDQHDCAGAAALLGYCILGPQAFAAANGPAQTETADMRLGAPCEAGHGRQAGSLLPTHPSRRTHPTP